MKVAINGFGRAGRCLFWQSLDSGLYDSEWGYCAQLIGAACELAGGAARPVP